MAGELCNTFELYIQNENLQNKVAEIDDLLCDLVDANKNSEENLKKVLLCIFRLLHNHNKRQIQFSSKPFHKLTAILLKQQKKQIIASILTCVKLYVQKFPTKESKYLIEELWAMSNHKDHEPHVAQVFVHLFDEFSSCIDGFPFDGRLQNVIRELLESTLREDRKSAYFIMKKIVIMHNNENVISKWGWSSIAIFEYGWITYVTVLENLDENQSHLILPSLASIKSIENSSQNWQPWMQILYKKLLSHNNILVLRWSLEFFLTNFTCKSLANSLLEEFFHAANHTHLYNVEGFCLPEKLVKQFLFDVDTQVLHVMSTINWRSVAFHYWLNQLNDISFKKTCVSKELLFKLVACVRCLQNTEIRESSKRRIFHLFDKSIDALSLGEYMDFVETLYNVSDAYYDHQSFHKKLKNCKDIKEISKSTKRFYQIFTNLFEIRYSYDFPYIHKDAELIHKLLLTRLESLPKEDHGWFRFLLTFDVKHDENLLQFCKRKYNLDLKELEAENSWEDIEQRIQQSLSTTREEKHFVREKSVDFFMKYRIKTWFDIVQLGLDPLQLLDIGSASTFLKLCKLLGGYDARVEDKVLTGFLHAIKKHLTHNDLCQSVVGHMLAYANKHCSPEEVGRLVQNILDIDSEHGGLSGGIVYNYELSNDQLIKGLLLGEAKIGEIRIEEAYEEMILHKPPRIMNLRSNYCLTNQKISTDLLDELLRINNELTLSKIRYFEHSKEHRLKMRIAYAILYLQQTQNLSYWSDELWSALFAPNNQLNISYMYELIIARCAPNIEVVLGQLRKIATHTASHQVSLISVIYCYSVINWKQVEIAQLQEIVDILLPMTMGVNFQVRLHAQLVIYKLIQRCEEHNMDLPFGASLKRAIELSFGDKLQNYLKDVRLKLPVFNKRSSLCAADLILYVTNAPYDECAYWCLRNSFDSEFQEEINSARKAYISKYFMRQNSTAPELVQSDFRNMQRKVNVPNDILQSNDVLGYATVCTVEEVHNELVCVASLIDKIPNLGGIARTCEVLGIKNLVLDSKLHVEKPDFKNLSMTSENNLNISEVKRSDLIKYFVSKRIDGYKIVGAEQTANSLSFADFKFPPKCILLLGHEKHGIPADLLGFLDYAVEVPQFGLVRSLNVHVTGALFMWEYCKQHKLEK